jgi:outer membrane protein assembly factor BamB
VLYRHLVIVNACVESESLVALEKQTGREVWRAEGIRESWNTSVLVELPGGKTELVVEALGQLLGFDPATGQRLWNCANGHNDYVCPSLVAHEGIVYSLGSRSGRGVAVRAGGRGDVTQTHVLWKGTWGCPNVRSPVYHDGHLYFADENHIARCRDAKTGTVAYEQRLKDGSMGDATYSSPVLADGKLYFVCFNGRT